MNSFIIARRQRKLRKFSENPFSGSRVSRVPHLGSRVSGSWPHLCDGFRVSGLTVRVPVPPMRWVPGLGSRFSDMSLILLFKSLLWLI